MSDTFSFLILDTYYSQFLMSLYKTFPELSSKRYAEQMAVIMDQCFGTADFYSSNLNDLGCTAQDIIANNDILQRQWAVENDLRLDMSYPIRLLNKLPKLRRWLPQSDIPLTILKHQIRSIRPDILYVQDIAFFPPSFISDIKKHVKLVVGQIACPLPDTGAFAPYDLILSSLPHYVDMFRSMGIKSEYFKIGFESTLLQRIAAAEPEYDVVHVGGYGPIHNDRNRLLEEIAKHTPVLFWGYGADNLAHDSPILQNYRGESWGAHRYAVFRKSKIVITKHIHSVANKYCNNMTLYEATGCGCLLVTDHKSNLHHLFRPGEEVVAYTSPEDAVEKIRYYLHNETERKHIALTGQERTLKEHSYYHRMQELLHIIKRYI
jgi:spore maturation protein CgeB